MACISSRVEVSRWAKDIDLAGTSALAPGAWGGLSQHGLHWLIPPPEDERTGRFVFLEAGDWTGFSPIVMNTVYGTSRIPCLMSDRGCPVRPGLFEGTAGSQGRRTCREQPGGDIDRA